MNSFIFDIRHFTLHDGPGIRTTVFFKGCPLRCQWCHNPESQEVAVDRALVQRNLDGKVYESRLTVGSWRSAAEVMMEVEKDEVFYLESGGGVTFSGGEPLMQTEALKELLQICKEKGYHTAVDTSGHAEPASVKKIMDLADLWLFDLKLMDDSKHLVFTGVSNELALNNLKMLARNGKEIIIRFPLIPEITDEEMNYLGISNVMKKLGLSRIDILPYHSIAREKYHRLGKSYLLEDISVPTNAEVIKTKAFFDQNGLDARVNS